MIFWRHEINCFLLPHLVQDKSDNSIFSLVDIQATHNEERIVCALS